MTRKEFTQKEIFAVEEAVDREATAQYPNKVYFMDGIAELKDGKIIFRNEDITDKVNDILKKWNS